MTNAQIVMNESIKLMERGIIGTTGRTIQVLTIDENGQEVEREMNEPEAIHTYAVWKQLGYQVQRGEKAVAQFPVWKCVQKNEKGVGRDRKTGEIVETEEKTNKMFMKNASWFKFSQVEPIQ